jgi:lantibiotic modifying enzyme
MFELTIVNNASKIATMPEQQKNFYYKNAAISIAKKICSEAIWHNDKCNFLTLSSENNFSQTTDYAKLMSSSFYDGLAGVLYFLSTVYSIEKDSIIKDTIEGILNTIEQQELKEEKENKWYGKLGFHTGRTGLAFAIDYAADVIENNAWNTYAENLLESCMLLSDAYYGVDIIDGIAGAIPIFIYFFKRKKEKKYVDFAIALGNHLLQKATKEGDTLSWNTMPEIKHNLTGYGHGTSGMAHCFAELAAITSDKNYNTIVAQIINYENKCYNSKESNWPDFRNFANIEHKNVEEYACSCAWCHGAPGIGLARLRCYAVTKNSQYLEDAIIAANTTLQTNKVTNLTNFSLCHGLCGNAELFQQLYEVTKEEKWKEAVVTLANTLSKEYVLEKRLLPSGLPSQKPVFDFMLGEAGMGYFLLRQYDSTKFKNILLFEP